MENSELQTQIKDLGKMLVKELGLEPGVDTFSRWMAHYIAEKMKLAETLPHGKDRDLAQNECFKTILKLWKRRHSLPNGKRPLENFETIFQVISRLNPDIDEPFLYRLDRQTLLDAETDNPVHHQIKNFLESALHVDKVARVWIEFFLQEAATIAHDEKTKAWLEVAVPPDADDIRAIKIVFKGDGTGEEQNDNSWEHDRLKRRIEELENFEKLNNQLLMHYKSELEKFNST
jgi:hypothetical protein